jgi:hypothetical protein
MFVWSSIRHSCDDVRRELSEQRWDLAARALHAWSLGAMTAFVILALVLR